MLAVQAPCKLSQRHIRRARTGCRACRRRGKRCDEGKPTCKACQRLALECSYIKEFVLYTPNHQNGQKSPEVLSSKTTPSGLLAQKCDTISNKRRLLDREKMSISTPANSDNVAEDFQAIPSLRQVVPTSTEIDLLYFKHFETQMHNTLPWMIQSFSSQRVRFLPLRYALLCLSASNMSNLDAAVDSRHVVNNARRSVSTPKTNKLHHTHAQKYHFLANQHCIMAEGSNAEYDASVILAAKVLLAFYHHSSTDHLQFRLAVWETVRFVLEKQNDILASPTGNTALQLWHRLCTSLRPSKPPALLIEGEGIGSFTPNLTLPGAQDYLYLKCVLGMSTDDLIYDILIRTMEIRTRLVVFRCTSWVYNISEQSPTLGRLAYKVMNKMMNRPQAVYEEAEAESGFAQGAHLIGLLEIQKERLLLWRSMLTPEQLPREDHGANQESGQLKLDVDFPSSTRFSTHRASMNYLYYLLCGIIFESSLAIHHQTQRTPMTQEVASTSINNMVSEFFNIVDALDLKQANLVDIYTFSLTEVLLQLTYTYQSEAVFNHVLDTIWPRIEMQGRGFENSHIPTHLAKRIIALLAEEWPKGRRIFLSMPAIPEDLPKAVLFDPNHQIDMVLYGYYPDGSFFIEKLPLP